MSQFSTSRNESITCANAELIRSAPGEPIVASISLDSIIIGLIFEISLSFFVLPKNPCGFNSISPSELFRYIPVFPHRTPEPYPLEKVIEK